MHMHAKQAELWVKGMQSLLEAIARVESPAHWRWAASCMAAVGKAAATFELPRKELRRLLRYANASAHLPAAELEECEQQLRQTALPQWLVELSGHDSELRVLNARQVSRLLVLIGTSSQCIEELCARFTTGTGMLMADWLGFVRTEQCIPVDDDHSAVDDDHSDSPQSPVDAENELGEAEEGYRRATEREGADLSVDDPGLSRLQFSLLLLCPRNDAAALIGRNNMDMEMDDQFAKPLAHYWTAASHKYLG